MKLGEVVNHRKGFITIDDELEYKLCRVQLHTKGVVLRSIIKGSKINTKKQQVCKSGDLIVAEMDAKVGGYGFIPDELDGAIVSSHYYLFELNYTKIKPKFLEVLFKLGLIQIQIKAVGSTNYAAIRPVDVLNWEIPDISYENQEKIEKAYDLISYFTSKSNYTIDCQFKYIDQLRQSLLKEAMQGKLVPQDPNDEPASELLNRIKAEKARLIKEKKLKLGKELPPIKPEEIPYNLPLGWNWLRLKECYYSIGSRVNQIQAKEYSDYGKYPIVDQGKSLIVGYNNNYDCLLKIPHNVVVFGDHTKNIKYIDFDFIIGADGVKILCPYQFVLPKFFYYCLSSLKLSDRGYARHFKVLNENLFPLPPLLEQQRIVEKLNSLMHLCDELKSSIEHSKDLNDRLLKATLREALTQ